MPLFIRSLFVSYVNNTPSRERIPYTQGDALNQEVLDRLAGQVSAGQVSSVQMEDETRENSLEADFRDGWATVYIVKECEHYFELVNELCPDCETELNITGDGPTPQKHATQDMEQMKEILLYFARTGGTDPACTWEHTVP